MAQYDKKKAWRVSQYHEEVERIKKYIVTVDGIEYIADDTMDNIRWRKNKVNKVVALYEKDSKEFLPHMRVSARGKLVGHYDFLTHKWTSGGPIAKKTEQKKPLQEGEVEFITIDSEEYMIDWVGNVYSVDDEELVGVYDVDKQVWITRYCNV